MDSPHQDGSFRSRLNLAGGKDRTVLVVALAILSAVSPMARTFWAGTG